jgi:hypothetical protein
MRGTPEANASRLAWRTKAGVFFSKPTGDATPPPWLGRIVTLLAVCLSLVCLWTVPARAAARAASTAAPELQLLGQGPVSVSAVQGKDAAEAYVTVLNAGSATASISASFQAASAASIKASLGAPTSLGPGEADRVRLIFTGLKALSEPVSGQIVIRGGATPVAQSATVNPALQPSADWPLLIVIIGFGSAALFFGGLATAVVRKKKGLAWLAKPAPPPKWSFESWATHLTAVGALLGTVLGTASLPETPTQIDKTSLVALSLLFGALVVVAPFVFEAIQRPTQPTSAESEGGSGFVCVLLLSCAITSGAVIGEIVTLGLASWEITGGGAGGVLIEIGLGVLFVLAVYYVTVTACNAAMTDWQAQAKASAPAPAIGAPGLAATLARRGLGVDEEALNVMVVPPATQPRSSWSLP